MTSEGQVLDPLVLDEASICPIHYLTSPSPFSFVAAFHFRITDLRNGGRYMYVCARCLFWVIRELQSSKKD